MGGRGPLGVGLVGCGAIGTALAHAIDEGRAGSARLVCVYDLKPEKSGKLVEGLRRRPRVVGTFQELIECDEVGLIVEAASQEAVRQYALRALRAGKDLMIMSEGALVDGGLAGEIRALLRGSDRRVYLPSGAIAGLDGLKAAAINRVDEVVLRTRKPPEGLRGAPYVEENRIDLDAARGPQLIYKGSASEACRLFPENVNVAAALSLAGIGPERTRVEVWVDPTTRRNVHEVHVRGEFGTLTVHAENVPSTLNPRTSALAVLSAIATLKKITERFQVGT